MPARTKRSRTTTKVRRTSKKSGQASRSTLSRGIASLAKVEDALAGEVRESVARTLTHPKAAALDAFTAISSLTKDAITMGRAHGGDVLVIGRAIARGMVAGISDAGVDAATAATSVAASVAGALSAGGRDATVLASRIVVGVAEATGKFSDDAISFANEARHLVEARLERVGHTTALLAGELAGEFSSLFRGAPTPGRRAVVALPPPPKGRKRVRKDSRLTPPPKRGRKSAKA